MILICVYECVGILKNTSILEYKGERYKTFERLKKTKSIKDNETLAKNTSV